MLHANDLRIGNYVLDIRVETIVTCIEENRLSTRDGKLPYSFYPEIEPIPLTEEWLIRAEFERFPWGWVHGTTKDKAVLIATSKSSYWVEIGNGLRIDLPYVHSLQNFFILTGTELTIK